MVTPANALLDDIDQVVFDEETIRQTVARLGAAISADYAGLNPLLVGSLTGVVIFMADLLRQITVPVSVDFMAVSHFASGQHAGSVRITKDLDLPITGRHVLFVEDVVDTGLTCDYLLRTLRTRRPASLKVCSLFQRPYMRMVDVPIDYVGLTLPDRFVVGYGLDADEYYRNLPFAVTLKPGVRRE